MLSTSSVWIELFQEVMDVISTKPLQNTLKIFVLLIKWLNDKWSDFISHERSLNALALNVTGKTYLHVYKQHRNIWKKEKVTFIYGTQNNPILKTLYAVKPVRLRARKSKLRPTTLKTILLCVLRVWFCSTSIKMSIFLLYTENILV